MTDLSRTLDRNHAVSARRTQSDFPARPVDPGLGLVVDPQPDDETCGPACLHGIYRHYGDHVPLATIAAALHRLDSGGTLEVFLANHALQRGYNVTLLTYNLELFDPTWFALPADEIRARLKAQAAVKKWPRLLAATRGFDEFLRLGGTLELRDLEPALLRKYLKRGIPLIAGLSATYLYRDMRDVPETNQDDDIRGEPVGHFVVLTGYSKHPREVMIADPLQTNPLVGSRYYAVSAHRLIGAILLGAVTYDANLVVIEPKGAAR
ncbi:MAG TPA: C39 family peptidase [Gammaproteobacteria bacterium]|nr:C39 family peptidase [Gammaproteobacteria bacterium]